MQLTIKQLAERLSLNESGLYHAIANKKLRLVKRNPHIVRVSDFLRWLDAKPARYKKQMQINWNAVDELRGGKTPEKQQKTGNGHAPGGLEMLFGPTYDAFKNLDITEQEQQNLRKLTDASKGYKLYIESNEKLMSVQAASGRLVDVDEVIILVRNLLEDLFTYMKNIHLALPEELCQETKIKMDDATVALEFVRNRLLDMLNAATESLEHEAKNFKNSHAKTKISRA